MAAAKRRLGPLELEVMQVVWTRGQTTVKEVWEKFYEDRGSAYTTIATVLRQLEKKGFVGHHTRERQFVYGPKVDRAEVSQRLLRDLVVSIFNGSAAELVTTLVQGEKLTTEELARIRAAIDAQSGAEGNDP